jgi:hypothetical protein
MTLDYVPNEHKGSYGYPFEKAVTFSKLVFEIVGFKSIQ